jgi:hypothetical protein
MLRCGRRCGVRDDAPPGARASALFAVRVVPSVFSSVCAIVRASIPHKYRQLLPGLERATDEDVAPPSQQYSRASAAMASLSAATSSPVALSRRQQGKAPAVVPAPSRRPRASPSRSGPVLRVASMERSPLRADTAGRGSVDPATAAWSTDEFVPGQVGVAGRAWQCGGATQNRVRSGRRRCAARALAAACVRVAVRCASARGDWRTLRPQPAHAGAPCDHASAHPTQVWTVHSPQQLQAALQLHSQQLCVLMCKSKACRPCKSARAPAPARRPSRCSAGPLDPARTAPPSAASHRPTQGP